MSAQPLKQRGRRLSSKVSRKSQVSDHRRLVELQPGCPNRHGCPHQREKPHSLVFEGYQDFANVEVFLLGSGRIGWEPPLNELLFPLGKPRGLRRNCSISTSEKGSNFPNKWPWQSAPAYLQSGKINHMDAPKAMVTIPSKRKNLPARLLGDLFILQSGVWVVRFLTIASRKGRSDQILCQKQKPKHH